MDTTPFDLGGKRALVTGGGRGIGRACALALARAGAEVAVTSRTGEQLAEVVAAIEARGGKARDRRCDIDDPADTARLIEALYRADGPPDILVNNAAISPIYKNAAAVEKEEWEMVLGVNLHATIRLLREIGAAMAERGRGSVVNITSVGSVRALPRLAPYSVGKAALGQLTRDLAVEWAPFGVRVNAVAPAYIETAMTSGVHGNERLRRQVIDRTPLGRFGQPHEVAWAVVFLASEAASYITGSTLFVDGGWTSL